MTRKEALEILLAKVEAGDAYLRSHYKSTFKARANIAWSAYHGSLDAAKSLHEDVLPGWRFEVGENNFAGSVASVWNDPMQAFTHADKKANHARAWLIAILKAMIVTEASREVK